MKQGCRACPSHFIENTNLLSLDALKMLKAIDYHTNLDKVEVEILLQMLRQRAIDNSIFEKFKSPYLPSEALCLATCGLSLAQFIELYQCVSPNMNMSSSRTISQSLAIYLFWLKTGCTQEIIAAYFGNDLIQQDISNYCDQVRKTIIKGKFIINYELFFNIDYLIYK